MTVRRFERLAAAAALGAGALFAVPAAAFAPHAGAPTARSPLFLHAAYSPVVMATQRDLNALGYDAGPADGLIGARTRSAISAYERDNGLLVTGNATAQVAAHLQATLAKRASAAAPRDDATADVQRQLRRMGRDVRVTGRADAETRAAIGDYQREHGLLVTGEASQALHEHMRDSRRARNEAGRAGANEELISNIQSELRQRGYRIDAITGRVDAQTEQAIRTYQRSMGLQQDAQPSAALLASLQQSAGAQPQATQQDQIRAVQEALNARGYSVGPADGALGPSTRNAIRTYRSDARLPVAGGIDAALLAKLGIGTGAAAGAAAPTANFVTRISDDFADGDYDRNPNWRVLAGEFTVRDGALQTTVVRRQESSQDIGRALLGNVLGQALGVRLPGAAEGAAIAQSTSVDNAFRVTANLTGSADPGALVNLGLFQGAEASSGYRLVYMADEQQPLRLLAVSGQEAATIAAVAPAARLNDGRRHAIEWLRAPGGRMTVRLDGVVVIDATDNRFTGAFDGFSLINGGGAWRLDSAAVQSQTG